MKRRKKHQTIVDLFRGTSSKEDEPDVFVPDYIEEELFKTNAPVAVFLNSIIQKYYGCKTLFKHQYMVPPNNVIFCVKANIR